MDKTAKEIMTKNVITISPETALMDVILKMNQYDVKEIPITDDKKQLLGMITYYDILDCIKADPNEKIKKMMVTPPTVTPDTVIEEIARVMISSGIEAIPVIENNQIIGIVSDFDIAKVLVDDPRLKDLAIKDVMRPAEHVLKKEEPISSARRMMRYHGIDRIPVVDNEGKSMGIILSLDILRKIMSAPKEGMGRMDAAGEQTSLISMPISAIMRTNTPVLHPDDSIATALEKLMKSSIKGAQVVDDANKVVGMFYRWDLLDKIVERKVEEGIWLNFSGLKLPLDTVDVLKNYLYSEIKRIKRDVPDAQSIDIHVRKLHGASEDKWNYEVNASLLRTSGNREIANQGKSHYGYNLMFTISDAVSKLGEQLEKRSERKSDRKHTMKTRMPGKGRKE
jgi:CBS domain-containing protein/ribosome-associated translation inhibitor RaiA